MNKGRLDKDGLARRVARDIPDGSFVNLGIGLPTKVSSFLDPSSDCRAAHRERHAGNGSRAHGGQVDPDLMNAGKIAVTELPGARTHRADSFAMMRGGHLDICVLGAYQVSATGDLANWHTGEPGAIPAVGGAMDLAIGAKRTFVMMNLLTKTAEAKSCRNAATRSPGWPASAGSTPTTRYSTSSRNASPSATSSARQSRSSKTSSRCRCATPPERIRRANYRSLIANSVSVVGDVGQDAVGGSAASRKSSSNDDEPRKVWMDRSRSRCTACELTTHDTNTPWPAPTTFRRHCISVSSPAATGLSGVHHHRRPSDVQPLQGRRNKWQPGNDHGCCRRAAFGTRTGRAPNALATSDIDTTPSLAMLYAPGGGSGCGQGDRGRNIVVVDQLGSMPASGTAASALAGLAYLVDRSG